MGTLVYKSTQHIYIVTLSSISLKVIACMPLKPSVIEHAHLSTCMLHGELVTATIYNLQPQYIRYSKFNSYIAIAIIMKL